MPEDGPGGDEQTGRLRRCIRDLVALQALPSMCIGQSPAEALRIVLDGVAGALGADVLHLHLAGPPPAEHAIVGGTVQGEEAALALGRQAAALEVAGSGPATLDVPGVGELGCATAAFPRPGAGGRLFMGRRAPLDSGSDIVLLRAAANLVATTLEAARVLDNARRKDDFLAELGHELRNPLAPILTAVELLAREPAVSRERRVIERHTRHLTRLVDDLLDISRAARGNFELERESVNVGTLLERASELAAKVVARKGHHLEIDPASDLWVTGDPVRLVQVFGNLLTNAAKFTPAAGRIEVRVAREGDRVRVVVRDSGRGLARDQLLRIFEPFVQADRERDALSGGLGLGLAIVKNLVQAHEGSIVARSDGPGRGAAFTVELPTGIEPATLVEPEPEVAASARSGLRVLVVDDNADLAELLSEALSYQGYATAVAHDAPAALGVARRFNPHAAVLDVGLPDVDGYQLARAMRVQQGSDVTLIAATGYGQRGDRERSAAAGFACHFVKPVSISDLLTALDTHLRVRREDFDIR